MSTQSTPHDGSYKHLFSHPEMVESLIRGFVAEEWVREIDFSTLEKMPQSYVTDDLRDRHDDIIWRVKWKDTWCYLYLLIEFQSDVDVWMAVRVMVYEGLLYQDLIKTGQVAAGQLLPPVFPLVLYNGEGRWTARQDVADLIAPMPGGLQRYKPSLRYFLVDEGAVPGEELTVTKGLCAILIRLERAASPEEAAAIIQELRAELQHPRYTSLRRAFTIWIRRVLMRRMAPGEVIPEVNDLEEVNAMLAERVRQWTEDWKLEGKVEGKLEGKLEGIKEGERKGQAALLQLQLLQRFGSMLDQDVQERLDNATSEQLETWGRRILDARSIDEVFGE
jgi:hypothetical protein